jgi:GTP-binding protein Era
MEAEVQPKKSGFAVMIGRSNVGKSTLLNALVGSKIAITSPKPQTTRLPIQGILTREDTQIVFVDTPGLMQKAHDELTRRMTRSIKESLKDVDVILYVVDPTREIGEEEKATQKMMEHVAKPKILVINKTDLPNAQFLDFYRDLAPDFDAAVEVSALRSRHLETLISKIAEFLPAGEFYYPDGQMTNLANEKWIAELIREKLFLRLRQEVPYTCHVEVEEIAKRENGVVYVRAIIYTTDERYKRIIIGAGGRGIKEIGQSTRYELEGATGNKYFLDLQVEVDPHWTERVE